MKIRGIPKTWLKKTNILLTIAFFVLLMASCSFNNLLKLDFEMIDFPELPEQLKRVYIGYYPHNYTMNPVVNLDSAKTSLKYIAPKGHGMWPERKIFIIDDIKYHLPWSGNRESPPFVLYEGNFYFLWTNEDGLYIDGKDELMTQQVRMIKLGEI